ncbi:MAG: hypothetical protein FWD40_09275 [Treponema sp.]|nr:hypothetical protein [Treponema sp.]
MKRHSIAAAAIILILALTFTACTRRAEPAGGDFSIFGEWRYIESSDKISGDTYEEERLTYPTTSVLSILKNYEGVVYTDIFSYAGMFVYYGFLSKADNYIYHFSSGYMQEIGTGYAEMNNEAFIFTYDPATRRLAWDDQNMYLMRYYEWVGPAGDPSQFSFTYESSDEIYYEEGDPTVLARQAFYQIMRQGSVDIFFTGESIPFNIDDYSIREGIMLRGYEGDPDIYEYPLYLVQKNGHDLMNIFGEEILVISDMVKTNKSIGVNSTIEEFAGAYPDFGIFYTYVSDKCWLETDQYPRIQFLLDKSDFLTEWDGSTIMELEVSDFNPDSRINKIRIYGDEMLFLH